MMPRLLPLLAFVAGCSCGTPSIGPRDTGDTGDTEQVENDLTDWVFDPEHVLRVEIDIDPDDWDALRTQTRDAWELLSGEDCLSEPFGSPFTYFPATVTIDGEVFTNVGVRKKGFLGSLSETKPALKVDLSEYGEAALYSGVERLTLNNAVSDASYLRQCFGYGFYADAGMPSSRCNYAVVQVNGDELGEYVNVEPLKKAFLRRHFDDDEGNLYEGTLSDFREGWTGTLEKKTNEDEDDWSDVEALVEALEAPDEELIEALEPVLDLDAFYTHWAAEVLSSHTDGYAWNTNNYYLYVDASDGGRLHFIPWGIDAILYGEADEGMPSAVYAYGYLANRLFELDESRTAYRQRLQELLDGPWDEDVFHARMERDRDLLLAEMSDTHAAWVAEEMEWFAHLVDGRREEVQSALDADEEWEYGLRDNWCFDVIGDLDASFETTWNSILTQDPFSYGDASLSFTMEDELFEPEDLGTVVGTSHGESVLYVAAWLNSREAVIAYFTAPEDWFEEPGEFELGFEEAVGALFYYDTQTMEDFAFVAYVIGSVELEQSGTASGDAVEGTMSGELMSFGW